MKNTKLNKRFNNKSNKKYTNKNVSKNRIGKYKTKKYSGSGGSGRGFNPGYNESYLENQQDFSVRQQPFIQGQQRGNLRGQPLSFNNPIYNSILQQNLLRQQAFPGRQPHGRQQAVRPGQKVKDDKRKAEINTQKALSRIDSKYDRSISSLKGEIKKNKFTLEQNQSVDIYKKILNDMSNFEALKEYLDNKKREEIKTVSTSEVGEVVESFKSLKEINNSKIRYIGEQIRNLDKIVPGAKDNMKNKNLILEYLKNLLAKHQMFAEYLTFKLQSDEDFNAYIEPIAAQKRLLGNPLRDEQTKLLTLLEYIKSLITLSSSFDNLIPLDTDLKLVTRYIKMIEKIMINIGNQKQYKKEVSEGANLSINNFTGEDFKKQITEARAAKKTAKEEEKEAAKAEATQKKEEATQKKEEAEEAKKNLTTQNYINDDGSLKDINDIIDHIKNEATYMDTSNIRNTDLTTKAKYRTVDVTKFTKIKKTINNEKEKVKKNINDQPMQEAIIKILTEIFKRFSLIEEIMKLSKISYTMTNIFSYIESPLNDLEYLLNRTKTKLEDTEKENKKPVILNLYEEEEEGGEGGEEEEEKLITYLKVEANEMLALNTMNKTKKTFSLFISEEPFGIIKKTIDNEIDKIKKYEKNEKTITKQLYDIYSRILKCEKIYKLTNDPPNITIDGIFEAINNVSIKDLQEVLSNQERIKQNSNRVAKLANKTSKTKKNIAIPEEEVRVGVGEGEVEEVGAGAEVVASNPKSEIIQPKRHIFSRVTKFLTSKNKGSHSLLNNSNSSDNANANNIPKKNSFFKKLFKRKTKVAPLPLILTPTLTARPPPPPGPAPLPPPPPGPAPLPPASEISMDINHYWYEGWVDHSGPFNKVKFDDNTTRYYQPEIDNFKKFVDMLVIDIKMAPDGGTVIHCSAGVGRTGTLSVILSIELDNRTEFNSQGDDNKKKADYIVEKIIKFRESRYWFVQDPAQLEFIYQYFGLYFNMGDVDQLTGIQGDFDKITRASIINDQSNGGKLMTIPDTKQDPNCNRYPRNILPHKATKVVLEDHIVPNSNIELKIDNLTCKSYINADTVDIGSGVKIIATQCPMANTIDSFKHMLVQKNVKRIIMLTGMIEGGSIKCSDYTGELLGHDTVEYGNPQTAESKFTLRKLELIVKNDSVDFIFEGDVQYMIISPIRGNNNDN